MTFDTNIAPVSYPATEEMAQKMSPGSWNERLVESYDRVAELYASRFFTELDRKPFDRELLDRYAEAVRGRGKVLELGCGPGHVSRYLSARGVDVSGLDLSPEMIDVARRLNSGITFERGNMMELEHADSSLAGIVAFYSLIHLARSDVPRALAGFDRVLEPDGVLLIAVHGGDGEIHEEQFLGEPVAFDATLFQPEELRSLFSEAGFAVKEVHARSPYEQEYPTQRIYVWATRTRD